MCLRRSWICLWLRLFQARRRRPSSTLTRASQALKKWWGTRQVTTIFRMEDSMASPLGLKLSCCRLKSTVVLQLIIRVQPKWPLQKIRLRVRKPLLTSRTCSASQKIWPKQRNVSLSARFPRGQLTRAWTGVGVLSTSLLVQTGFRLSGRSRVKTSTQVGQPRRNAKKRSRLTRPLQSRVCHVQVPKTLHPLRITWKPKILRTSGRTISFDLLQIY